MINYQKDNHVHTNYSPDADKDATFQNYITQAQELGLTEITFTDHLDFDPGHPLFETPINYDEYIEHYNQVKQTSPIKLNLGIEIGYQPQTVEETNNILNKYNFDYVVLSIHYIDKQDFYTKEYFQNKTKEEAYIKYFNTCLEAIKNTPQFTTFGHLDYITRYSPYGDYDYNKFKGQIDLILLELIKRNKNLEINTSGFKTKETRTYPKQEVINRYIELGGTSLVLSSDAHNIDELGRYFKDIKITKEK